MNAKLPITTVFLAAAALLLGGAATAQRRSVVEPSLHRPTPESGVRGYRGDYGHRSRTVSIRAHPVPPRQWVPGHYEWITQQVFVPGRTERVWVDPVYEWRVDYRGCRYGVLVRAGYWNEIRHPGHYEPQRVRIWRPGYWQYGYGGYR